MSSRSLDRSKLSKLLGLLGSSHDGERAAAALKADQMVRRAGTTWANVLTPNPVRLPPPGGIPGWIEPRDGPHAVSLLLDDPRHRACLNTFERDVLTNLRRRGEPYTRRQSEILWQCVDLARGKAAAALVQGRAGR